jgi:hypothetical protein
MTIEPNRKILLTITSYVVWFAVTAGLIFLLLSGRSALMAALARFSARGFDERMRAGMLDKMYMIVVAVLVLGASVLTEYYLTHAGRWSVLWDRVLRCVAIEAVVLAITAGITQVAARTLFGSFGATFALFLPVAGGAIALAGSLLLRRREQGDG